MTFSINNKKFQKDYYNKIISGIHKRYKKIYQNSQIDVEYKISKNIYTFFVYVTLDIINDKGIVPEKTLIKTYNNFEAITYFSPIPLDEYIAEYDDSRKNYLDQFIEEVTAIIMSYKILGMNIEPLKIGVNSNQYSITIIKEENTYSWSGNEYICGYFKFNGMITKEEYKKNLCDVKDRLKKVYEKWLSRQ